jgi:hypothetical protein
VEILLFTSSSLLPPPPLLQTLRASELLHSPCARLVDALQDPCAKEQMGKTNTTNASTNWVPTEFKQTDLSKALADGLIADGDQVIFPSTERIPKPLSGFRVMFLAFLLRGLSFPAHEFLHGLLFVYGVQLHQLTPNLILHIACFITLCESFLGIEPHFLLWKYLFRLRPSVALSKRPELGRAVVSVHAKSQYLEFSMVASVQGWRKKWFYIKDQKVSSSNQYGIAPFDAAKNLKKLALWDSPPTKAEMEDIKPLLARIQVLKSENGGALSGTQLMAFLCNVEFGLFSIVFLSFGCFLAWEILFEYLMILWRRRISTSE